MEEVPVWLVNVFCVEPKLRQAELYVSNAIEKLSNLNFRKSHKLIPKSCVMHICMSFVMHFCKIVRYFFVFIQTSTSH